MKHNSVAPLISLPPLAVATRHKCRMLQCGAELVWNIVFRSRSVLLALMMISGTSVATAISVTTTNDSGGGSLRQAIADAVAGDTITFSLPPNSSITLTSGELLINKSLTINGAGANQLTVRRDPNAALEFRIFNITGNINVTITGLTIAFGKISGVNVGGGILNDGGTLTITNSTISGNSAGTGTGTGGGGGGIAHLSGTLTITNSTISGNSTQKTGGGIAHLSGTLTITNSTISDNSSNFGGGIRHEGGTLRARSTIIALNTAPNGPDVLGTLTSDGFNLIGNDKDAIIAPATGDQIGRTADQLKLDSLKSNGGPTQTHALLSGSFAIEKGHSSGSGTDQRGLARPVDDPGIDNHPSGDGADIGAYEVQADQLPGCTTINRVVNNNNDSGADSLRTVIANVCAGSTITFAQNVTGAITLTSGELVINKSLTINGPGANVLSVQRSSAAGTPEFRIFSIESAGINVTITGLTIANGKTSGFGSNGGGILNAGRLTLSHSTLSGNSSGFSGGGIANNNISGTLILTNATVSDNSAGAGGGGISGGTVDVTNSTISGNRATSGEGGGIAVTDLNLVNSTITGNSASSGSGGGVYNSGSNGASVKARNTIIALNTAPTGPDVQGALTSENFNLIGSSAGATISPAHFSDQVGVTAAQLNLGALQNNGGPTQTHALLSGSRAIDKGHSSGSSTDQRGFSRPEDHPTVENASGGDGGDIGAFEVPAPPATPTPTATPTVAPTATPTATPAATPGLVGNVSTRLPVGTGDNVLIEGFIVQGPDGSTKKIMVRAIGPSLLPFGIADALGNPILEIRDAGNTLIAANDDWGTTQVGGIITGGQSAEISGSGLAPENDLESAIIANLAPGSYTAVVRGVGDTVGTGVVDAFDMSAASPARLANIATRGLIQPGDKLMIAGFIIQNGPVRAVVLAIGPSLSAFGISNALPDTTLQLRDQNGVIVRENDDWQSDQKQELEETGLQPSDPLEAAVVETLQPGQYTVQVRGKPETTGIGVVQVYFLQ